MGKQIPNGHTNGIAQHNKTNPSFKWGRMFHLLDYHHWYYVKKVLANKKHHEGSNDKVVERHSQDHLICDGNTCYIERPTEKPQNQGSNSHISTESSTSASSPRSKGPPLLSSSPSAKSSRATRIKNMIAREVTKRRGGRHRRSSTCPVSSDLVSTNDGANNGEMVSHNMKDGENNTCGLCSTMKLECQLGDKKQVGDHGELSLKYMNIILHDDGDHLNDQLHLYKNIRRSVSMQQSTEFIDVMDVMSLDKRFFLRILDDPRPPCFRSKSLDDEKIRRKPLTKCGTFPVNDPSSYTSDIPFDATKVQQKSSYEKANTTLKDGFVPRLRFRDLRQKIKHVIKESKKERHIIAMDAVLHKVPYGQKVPEESAKDSPCVSNCETEFSFPQETNKDIKPYKKRSPSLDGSLDRYSHLFETTSCSKEAITDTHIKSRLRVMDDHSNKSEQKRLGRIFSFPDLQVFFNNQYENYSGDIPLISRNKRIMSFNERKVQEILDKSFEFRNRFDEVDEKTTRDHYSSKEDNVVGEKVNEVVSNSNCVELLSRDDEDITTHHVLMRNKESISEVDDHFSQETPLEGLVTTHQITTESEDLLSESPTFSCTKVDEEEVKNSLEHISPSLLRAQVDSEDVEEFNYVRDILQLSGYLDTELLGTWYSSDQPVAPSIFVEFESSSELETKSSSDLLRQGSYNNHLLLFDLINETLVAIYERCVSYWCAPLSSCSRTHPIPKGDRILDEVWLCIKWYMNCSKPELDPSLDCITSRDLAKDDKWMNLQFDAECVGLEVEEMIFDDLLDEVTS
ncbi:hypothetical protein RND81_10G192500 [Saponaria officinalis]|uniref:DUF4378 domain-containing protein n=1 Tax=Saponaria officinalis TaxID=3572 RepID=A0AAW1I4R6_SAPOF